METIDADALCALLEAHPTALVIDCRPYSEYILGHAKGALSVQLSSLLLRRLNNGRIGVSQLLHDDHRKLAENRLDRGCMTVVYDDGSTSTQPPLDQKLPLHAVYQSLRATTGHCAVLTGGFNSFQRAHADLTTASDDVMSPQISPTCPGEPNLVSQPHSRDINPTEILPFLYVGAQNHASDMALLQKLGIGYILNVSTNLPNYFPEVLKYKNVRIKDTWDQQMTSFFNEAFEFIDEAVRNNSKIMVHCMAGISRSPTVTIAYLMRSKQMPLCNAFNFVRDKRHSICPNLDFMAELYEYEKTLQLPPSQDCGYLDSPHERRRSVGAEDRVRSPLAASTAALAALAMGGGRSGCRPPSLILSQSQSQPPLSQAVACSAALARAPASPLPPPKGGDNTVSAAATVTGAAAAASAAAAAAAAAAATASFPFAPSPFVHAHSSIPSSPASPRSDVGIFAL